MLKPGRVDDALWVIGKKCWIARPVALVSETGDVTVMASALADFAKSSDAAVRVSVPIHYQIRSCLRTIDGRQSTFLYLKTWGKAANQSQWRSVA
jgi:hypothetical protein